MERLREQAFPTFIHAFDITWVSNDFKDIENVWDWFREEAEGLPYDFFTLHEQEKWWVLHLIAFRRIIDGSGLELLHNTANRMLRKGPGDDLERFSLEVNMLGDVMAEIDMELIQRSSFILESGLDETLMHPEFIDILKASGEIAKQLRVLPKEIYTEGFREMLRPDAFETAGYTDIQGTYSDCFSEYFLTMIGQDDTWHGQPSAEWRSEYITRVVNQYTRFTIQKKYRKQVARLITESLQPLGKRVSEWAPSMTPDSDESKGNPK